MRVNQTFSVVSLVYPPSDSYHPDWPAGAHVITVGIPALEFGVLSVLQDELLALEVRMVKADKGAALHAGGVHAVHEPSVLKVVALAADLQFPPRETFSLVEHDLFSAQQRKQSVFCRFCADGVLLPLTFPEY